MGRMRGHVVVRDEDGVLRYKDNSERVAAGPPDRACDRCKQKGTSRGHDACLGTLPGVRYACCGHGDKRYAYIHFETGETIREEAAITVMRMIKAIRGVK